MPVLPFGEWLPDQPDYANPGATTIKNVIPRTKQSYGPMPTPQVYSGALTARCQGCYAYLDDSQAVHVFAGDATKLYQLTAGSAPNFTDVSRLVGGAYATGSPITPLIPTAPSWSMTAFGKRIIATNYSDDVQTFLVGTDTNFSKLSTGAPKARFAMVVGDFLVLLNTNDGTFGAQPRRAWWSAIGDPTNWPTPASNTAISVQSDFQDLEQSDLGQITGGVGGHLQATQAAIWCERGIYRMNYIGSAGGIFSFQVAEGAAGTQSPLSLIPCRMNDNIAVVAYLGEGGDFRVFDGMTSTSISNQKFSRFFINDLSPRYLSMVQGGTVPNESLIYWMYVSNSGAGSGLYDRIVIYNTAAGVQRGALIDISATPAEWGTKFLSPGLTLDALDVYGSLDAVPSPLDSAVWAGGSPVLAFFDSNHKLNLVNGPAMAPTVETSEAQPTPGRRSKILSARPLHDGGSSAAIAVAVRDRLMDSPVYGAAVTVNSIGECPQRVTGRYARARFTMNAGETFTHLQGIDATVKPEGRR